MPRGRYEIRNSSMRSFTPTRNRCHIKKNDKLRSGEVIIAQRIVPHLRKWRLRIWLRTRNRLNTRHNQMRRRQHDSGNAYMRSLHQREIASRLKTMMRMRTSQFQTSYSPHLRIPWPSLQSWERCFVYILSSAVPTKGRWVESSWTTLVAADCSPVPVVTPS